MNTWLKGKYDKPILIIVGIDILFVILSITISTSLTNSAFQFDRNTNNTISVLGLLILWVTVSFNTKKYKISDYVAISNILSRLFRSNFMILSIIAIILIILNRIEYSRSVLIGTIFFSTIFEFIISYVYFEFTQSPFLREWIGLEMIEKYSRGLENVNSSDIVKPPLSNQLSSNIVTTKQSKNNPQSDLRNIFDLLVSSIGDKAALWISTRVEINNTKTLLVSTTTRFNIDQQHDNHFQYILNLAKINDILRLNKFFESVNKKLLTGGLFVCRGETYLLRKKRILGKYPFIINYLIYTIDYIGKRVLPKLKLTQKMYFLFSRGRNRVLSKTEILGRLYSCGFHVVDEEQIDGLFYCIATKIKDPVYDYDPTYGPIIRLRRIGKAGKIITVYKLRTMHPYAEYIQQYMFEKNGSKNGDKVNNDFRVNTLGAFFRKFWLDELPMIYNLLKGDLKIVGVRPLSETKFQMYPEDFRLFRIHFKPGLIPPFYADIPNSFDEIIQSELNYLLSYQKKPLATDFKYFFKAMYQIIFKNARSK